MKIIIGGKYYPTLEAKSVKIDRAISDPVSACTLNLIDNTSSLVISEMMEVLVLDDQAVINPTINFLQNPSLVPYTNLWNQGGAVAGITLSTVGGGGIQYTFANAANGAFQDQYQWLPAGLLVGGQTYTISFYAQGTAPVGFRLKGYVKTVDAANNLLTQFNFDFAVPTSLTRKSMSFTAPAGTSFGDLVLEPTTTSATNSGSVTITSVQWEPNWFPTLSYPTPFCGAGQTNCQILPNDTTIRQARKFGGFVTHITNGPYIGNVRTITVAALGYGWLMATHLYLTQAGFTNQTDAYIINNIISNVWPGIFSQNHVQVGYTISQIGYNYVDIRSIFDGLAALAGFFWRADDYWDIWYLAPGYNTLPISLICDNSVVPDMVTTFPAYEFLADIDFTQPCNQCTVAGQISGATQAVRVVDPNSQAKYAVNGQPTVFEHLINDSTLQSYNDMVQRGTVDVLTYSGPRDIYHLKTNVNLDPGNGVPVTSATDGLNQTVLLIQKTSATWLGTDETLTDVWEYACDLGAYNPTLQNILKHINYKIAASQGTIPVVNQIRLVIVEPQSMAESEVLH